MNTSELFHQLQAAVTKKQYEMKGKKLLFILVGINADTEKFEMITKCFDLVTEYGKTRHKIKRLVKDTETSNSESPAKNQGKHHLFYL